MAQHTPGPWRVHDYGISSGDDYSSNVARCRDGHVYDEYDSDPATLEFENEADARLIAAAPEMLDALEAINDGHLPDQPASSSLDEYEWAVQHIRRLRAIARAALTLAKGEG